MRPRYHPGHCPFCNLVPNTAMETVSVNGVRTRICKRCREDLEEGRAIGGLRTEANTFTEAPTSVPETIPVAKGVERPLAPRKPSTRVRTATGGTRVRVVKGGHG